MCYWVDTCGSTALARYFQATRTALTETFSGPATFCTDTLCSAAHSFYDMSVLSPESLSHHLRMKSNVYRYFIETCCVCPNFDLTLASQNEQIRMCDCDKHDIKLKPSSLSQLGLNFPISLSRIQPTLVVPFCLLTLAESHTSALNDNRQLCFYTLCSLNHLNKAMCQSSLDFSADKPVGKL